MTARADILSGKFKDSPAAIAALRSAGDDDMAKLFASFVGYASVNWNYAATSGAQTAPDLLAGEGTKSVACGTLREALKIIVREDMKLTAENADINGHFLTKRQLSCFDPKVKGNVGNRGATTYDLACHFSTHYFLKTNGKYYDACLTSTYAREDEPILQRTRGITGVNMRKAGTGKALIFIRHLAGENRPRLLQRVRTSDRGRLQDGADPARADGAEEGPRRRRGEAVLALRRSRSAC